MDFKDIEISVYNGVRDTQGHRSTLFDFLNNVDYDAISKLRSTDDLQRRRQIKLSLPQATISGVFAPTRSADNLVKHSGLICVDIDQKENLHILNFETLIEDLIRHLNEVMYAAHSVSGSGYFLIIPLRYPERHKAQFQQLIKDFNEIGIKIDRACGDVCRLRCQSLDSSPYINLNAKAYSGIYHEPKSTRKHIEYNIGNCDDEEKVAALCREIEKRHIDLTSKYDDWIKIGASLSNLGESGRKWFHLCSEQNSGYNALECDRKFDNLLRSTRCIGLGTFFYACKNAGLTL